MAKLEQIVFYNSTFESSTNPISLELQNNEGYLSQASLELSLSICGGMHPQLPNVIDETTFLTEAFHRSHEVILAISRNNVLEKVFIVRCSNIVAF